MEIRPLAAHDRGYALTSWREAHKTSPGCDRAPWWAYKREYGEMLAKLVNDASTTMLGAYDGDTLLGFLVMTPGKRVHTLHWVQVKNRVDGKRVQKRREIMFALMEAANLGTRFIYTLRGPRCKNAGVKSLDELLVAALRAQGVVAAYTPLKEWLQ